MPIEVLEQKINTLSLEQQHSVFDFIDFLIAQNASIKEKPKKTFIRMLGGYEGQIKISDDFDEIPEGFEEYI